MSTGSTVVGRDAGSVFADDPFVSPQHANFTVTRDGVTVEDLGSLNGVFVRVTEETEIVNGSEIRLGQELLRFQTLTELEPMITSSDDTRVLGSPNVNAWGRLERVVSPDASSHAYLLVEPRVVLGRDRGDIVFRDDGFVSGTHAQVSHNGGKSYLKDLGSSNGTYVRLTEPQRLGPGSLVLIGQQVVRLTIP